MTEIKKGLFDKLYAASKEAVDALKKPLVRNQIKRKLEKAHDDATDKINEANIAIDKHREDFSNYDVNAVLKYKATITQCKNLQTEIKAEYEELFAKSMPVELEEED